MRIGYLDCFAGISGDMFLGALVDAGVPARVLEEAAAALGIGASVRVETVDRSGVRATKVHVLEDGVVAEEAAAKAHEQSHEHSHEGDSHGHHHEHGDGHTHSHSHSHSDAEKHVHGKPHVHGRSLGKIREVIEAAALSTAVKGNAIRTFELLGTAEAKIHNVPVEKIHFHEVGAVDAIVDIVGACAALDYLEQSGPIAWYCSAVNVGSGTVECAHGTLPVPAPATADLLRGMPTYAAHIQKEMVTPTGAALLRLLGPKFGEQPGMRVASIGYGAGGRNPSGFANVLRVSLGEAVDEEPEGEVVTVLDTALDDLNPQVLAMVSEQVLIRGALDAMLQPVVMKKGRSGTLLTVLCRQQDATALEDYLFRETSTLGVRRREERRTVLDRRHDEVTTPYGVIRVKLGLRNGVPMNIAPEFEDCRAAAEAHQVPVKQVIQAAISAWTQENGL